MSDKPGYRRPQAGTQPDYLHPAYQSTNLRSPSQPLVFLPHSLSEITGPTIGAERINEKDNDLTAQHDGEPQGERIIIHGRVLDENGLPVPGILVEIWQANAAGRYNHKRDLHDAPLDPNFTGTGRTVTDADGRVLHRFSATAANRLWLTDTTEHPTKEGKLYCCAIKDVFSGRIVERLPSRSTTFETPTKPAMNSPSGRNACRICTSAPGRSFT